MNKCSNVLFAVTLGLSHSWIKLKCVGESCLSLTAFNLSPLSLLTVTGPMASPEWDEAVIPCDQWELEREREWPGAPVAWSALSLLTRPSSHHPGLVTCPHHNQYASCKFSSNTIIILQIYWLFHLLGYSLCLKSMVEWLELTQLTFVSRAEACLFVSLANPSCIILAESRSRRRLPGPCVSLCVARSRYQYWLLEFDTRPGFTITICLYVYLKRIPVLQLAGLSWLRRNEYGHGGSDTADTAHTGPHWPGQSPLDTGETPRVCSALRPGPLSFLCTDGGIHGWITNTTLLKMMTDLTLSIWLNICNMNIGRLMSARRVVSLNISLSRCQSFSWAGGASAWQWPSVSRVLLTPACSGACSLQSVPRCRLCRTQPSLTAQAILCSASISDSTQVPGKLVIQIINEMGVNRRETSMRGIRPGSAHFDPVTSQRL